MKYLHRVLPTLLAMVMTFALCACKGENTNAGESDAMTTKNEDVPSVTVPPLDIPHRDKTPIADDSEEFREVIAGHVDLDLYDDPYSPGEGNLRFDMKLDEQRNRSYDLSNDVVLDGRRFTFPATYSDLVDAGWSTDVAEDTQIESQKGFAQNVRWTNEKGTHIITSLINWSGESKAAKDCQIIGVFISVDTKASEPQDISFAFCGKVANASGMQEVISMVGPPTSITYNASDDHLGGATIVLRYDVKVDGGQMTLEIDISAQTDEIMEISCDHIAQ